MPQPQHRHESRPHARRVWHRVGLAVALVVFAGCRTRHAVEVEPTYHTVKIEPIFMTVDINIRVQEELDRFYSDIVSDARTGREQGEPR